MPPRPCCGARPGPWCSLAPDLTTPAQRSAIALADSLRAEVDGATSDTGSRGPAGGPAPGARRCDAGRDQEPRRRGAVLGGGSPGALPALPRALCRGAFGHPRHAAGRISAVSVGADRGPAKAELAAEFAPELELEALGVIRAVARGRRLDGAARCGCVPPSRSGSDCSRAGTSPSSTTQSRGGTRATTGAPKACSRWRSSSTGRRARCSWASAPGATARAPRRRSPGRPGIRCA